MTGQARRPHGAGFRLLPAPITMQMIWSFCCAVTAAGRAPFPRNADIALSWPTCSACRVGDAIGLGAAVAARRVAAAMRRVPTAFSNRFQSGWMEVWESESWRGLALNWQYSSRRFAQIASHRAQGHVRAGEMGRTDCLQQEFGEI